MDMLEMYIHAFASPAARNVAGRLNATGQINIAPIPWKCMISAVVFAVRSDRLYAFNIKGSKENINNTIAVILT